MILPIPNERPRLPPTVQIEKSDAFSSLDDAYQRLKKSLESGDESMRENVLQELDAKSKSLKSDKKPLK
jgi:hypothetical protein